MEILDSLTPELFIEHHTDVLKAVSNGCVRAKIPLISNLEHFDGLNDGQLVRFRGLVQNMFDPEIYLEQYQTKDVDGDAHHTRNGKYRDILKMKVSFQTERQEKNEFHWNFRNFFFQPNEELVSDSTDDVHGERRVFFMVSIPGLNDWAVDLERTPSTPKIDEAPAVVASSHGAPSVDQMEVENMSDNKETANQNDQQNDDPMGDSILSREYLLNSPIVDRPSTACLMKFYDNSTATDVSLNDVLDVIGFVSLDPSLCASSFQDNDNPLKNANEVYAMNPPPSLIPRIHVISYRKLLHTNPLLHDDASRDFEASDQDKYNAIRDLHRVFSQCLFGDSVAADYLLCHLISTVYIRGDETLGKFCLNLTNFPEQIGDLYTKELYGIIESCLPASHYFPVTIDSLNNTEFVPT